MLITAIINAKAVCHPAEDVWTIMNVNSVWLDICTILDAWKIALMGCTRVIALILTVWAIWLWYVKHVMLHVNSA